MPSSQFRTPKTQHPATQSPVVHWLPGAQSPIEVHEKLPGQSARTASAPPSAMVPTSALVRRSARRLLFARASPVLAVVA